MGLRAVGIRGRADARRAASWLALVAAAVASAWLATGAGPWRPAVALAAGALATTAALGCLPAGGPDIPWAASRCAWPAAGIVGGWCMAGALGSAVGTTAVMLGGCAATTVALVIAARAGLAPADASAAALGAAVAAAWAGGVAIALGAAAVWFPAAAVGWIAAVVGGRLLGDATAGVGPGVAAVRFAMPAALAAMVICFFLAPHLAWVYAGLAATWLLIAVPCTALGPGADGEQSRRALLATLPGRRARPARGAAGLIASQAAVLVWPPLVAAALAGTSATAAVPLGIAAAIAGGAAGLLVVVAGAHAAGVAGETALAIALCMPLVALMAMTRGGAAAPSWGIPAGGLMLSNPADPARLPGPRRDSRRSPSPRGDASCPDSPSPASARSFPPRPASPS